MACPPHKIFILFLCSSNFFSINCEIYSFESFIDYIQPINSINDSYEYDYICGPPFYLNYVVDMPFKNQKNMKNVLLRYLFINIS